ncbi:hypothetical protein [Subtercola vilae]|uniref:hypothetical protein n=1 Tax=Subtercola vilae TaxID=2056433 RepID=UPI001375551F|nr:hypothetical protein [Subtercola vilae]
MVREETRLLAEHAANVKSYTAGGWVVTANTMINNYANRTYLILDVVERAEPAGQP